MSNSDKFSEELELLQLEYAEYQSQSKEYEEALEKELEEKESKLIECLDKYREAQSNLDSLKKKYQQNETEIVRLQLELDALRKKIKVFEDQKQELESLNDQWEKSARILEYSKQNLEERLYQAEENAILYKEELEELSNTRKVEVQRLKDQYHDLQQEFTIAVSPPPFDRNRRRSPTPNLKQSIENVITIPTSASRPQSRNPSRNISRKQSFDENASKQNVKVLVVFRPPLQGEGVDEQVLRIEGNTVSVRERNKEVKTFEFEKILPPQSAQIQIFEEVQEGIEKLSSGGNTCVMAYGQTGSGKTYTMNYLISQSLLHLSGIINTDYEVSMQCIEVYNEQLKNLLSDDILNKNWKEVLAKSEIKLGSDWKDSCWDLVQKAISRRTTKFTECNERSSRSHAIIWLTISGPSGVGRVQFVDLAGSERIGKSQVVGETLKEALLINKSLSALQDVVSALENRQKHIPYRNSMLTQILQPTLGGSESTVTMIMNCSPAGESTSETLCTLALGSRVKAVDLGFFIRKNLVTKEVERTLSLLEKERSEKNSLLRTLDKLQRDLESYQFAIKDKDNKIVNLTNKLKLRDRAEDVRGKIKKGTEYMKIGKKGNYRFEESEVRVGSMSPTMSSPLSPSSAKASRIPTLVSLKLGKKP